MPVLAHEAFHAQTMSTTGGLYSSGPLRVAVIGLWHLGCVAAACLARLGHRVLGVEEDEQRLVRLLEGRAPLAEPGLDDLLAEGLASGRLQFTGDLPAAVAHADVAYVAYDTAVTDRDEVDVSVVRRAVDRIASLLGSEALLLVQSQVPVGTCRRFREMLRAAPLGNRRNLAYVPENLRLGQAIEYYLHPDLVVIGADDPPAHAVVDRLFAGIEAPRVRTDLVTAEMAKHAINTFLATSISFANELANLCQTQGVDALTLVSILRLDRRIGPHVPLNPGMGFAGGTLARDVRALTALGDAAGYTSHLLEAVLRVNASQRDLPIRWLRQIYGTLSGLRVGVLGLTYKPGTSTLRRSVALEVIRELVAEGVHVAASDPQADLDETTDLPEFVFRHDAYETAAGTEALLIMTLWPEFVTLDFERVLAVMRRPVVLDMCNALDRARLERLGFVYVGVGRGPVPRLTPS